MSDINFMERALALAENGRPFASPNPLVGCVVVRRGRAVGEGWHAAFGGAHAETEALRRAGRRAAGATLYINLEPCAHWGKTPPCAQAVVRAGVRRVVAAVRDPNPSVSGRGFAILRKGRVRVETGLLAREAEFVNRAFFKRHRAGLPYVIWKTAQTLDGKTASRTGASRWITGPEARAMGHRLRGQSDAILVGGETVRRDDPGLTAHGQGPDPLILVLSRSLDIPTGARIFKSGAPVWIATGPNPPAQRAKALQKRGAEILKCSLKNSKVDLINLFKLLSKMNVNQILFEGGGATAWGLLESGLLDEAYVFQAPGFLGGRDAKTSLEGAGWTSPRGIPRLSGLTASPVGQDMLLHGYLGRSS